MLSTQVLQKAAEGSLAEGGQPAAAGAHSFTAKELRSRTGIPASSTVIVCSSAAAASSAKRDGGVQAAVVGARLDLGLLGRLLTSFAPASLDERGF